MKKDSRRSKAGLHWVYHTFWKIFFYQNLKQTIHKLNHQGF